jgi:hypothetical protein
MSFIFSQVNPSKIGEAAQPYGAADYYGAAFDQGLHDRASASLYRISEYNAAQDEDPVLNPRIPASEANHYAQQEGVDLKFTLDPTIDEYTVLMDRKTKERDRNLILSGGADGIMRSAGAIGVGFIGSLLSPLDLALNFLPIVGVGAKAATGAKAVGIGAKVSRALSRGIVTEQTLAARGIAMKGYTAAIIEGTVGQAITEIPLMISNKQDQTKYTSSDFALNVALGGAFGVGVHSLVKLGKSIHGRMKEAKLAHGRLTPETHENMAGAALEDFLEGGEIDPARVSLLDDNQLKGRLIDDRLLWHSGDGNGPEDSDGPIWFSGTKHNNLAAWGADRDFQISVKGRDVPVLIDPYDSLALNAGFFDGYTDPKLNSDIHHYILKHTGEEDLTFTKDGKFDNGDEAADQASELHVRLQELTLENPEIGKELIDIFLEFKSRNPEAFEKLMDESSFMLVDRIDLPINSKERIDQEEAKAALRSAKETSVEERTANANRQLELYKNHESQKAIEKAKQLDQEIAAGKTLEDPEPYTFTGDLAHINNELKALDDEILSLEDELGDLAFELDPRLTGDVGNIANARLQELLETPFIKNFQEAIGERKIYHQTEVNPRKISKEGFKNDYNYFSQEEGLWDGLGKNTISQKTKGLTDRLMPDPETSFPNFPDEWIPEKGGWGIRSLIDSDIPISEIVARWEKDFLDEIGDWEGSDVIVAGPIAATPDPINTSTRRLSDFDTFDQLTPEDKQLAIEGKVYKNEEEEDTLGNIATLIDDHLYVATARHSLEAEAIDISFSANGDHIQKTNIGAFKVMRELWPKIEDLISSIQQQYPGTKFSFSGVTQSRNKLFTRILKKNKIPFEIESLSDDVTEELVIFDPPTQEAKQLDQEIAAGPTDFTNIRQAEFPVPFSRWKAFLPENPPGNHTWKAEDVTYATQQFIPEYKELFDEFFELDPTLKDINMEFDPLLLKDHNAAGMYKGSEDRILIAEDYGQPSTVVHELTHASVVRRMRKDMESVGELKGLVLEGERYLASLRRYAALTENDGFRGIIEAYLKTVEHHGTQHTGGYSLASSVNVKTWERFSQRVKEPQYGLLNLDEFIAEGLSNRQFQLYLNSIKSGKETVLSKFMKMVKSIFKLEENPNSVLAQLLDGYETAIKQAGDRIDGPASLKMTKADVLDIGAPVLQQASNCIL